VVYHPDVIEQVESDSDKVVEIVSDERLPDHEPFAVPEQAVASALLASGMFLDDDARALAGPIAARLATMHADEAVRIVGWAEDAPRYYYVLVHHHRLQIVYYAGSRHADEYSGVIPTEAQPIHAPSEAAQPAQPAAVPEPAHAAPEPAAVAVAPAPMPTARPHRAHAAVPGYTPITEAEARRRLHELDEALQAGLIDEREHRVKRKEVLSRL
jgi:hypothetical protein